jgi:hypothetical protein
MSAASIKKRLKKIERQLYAPDDGTFTLEQLCRSMWHADKKDFLELARQTGLSRLAKQFELEDAEQR